jgi:hypothetical protein
MTTRFSVAEGEKTLNQTPITVFLHHVGFPGIGTSQIPNSVKHHTVGSSLFLHGLSWILIDAIACNYKSCSAKT